MNYKTLIPTLLVGLTLHTTPIQSQDITLLQSRLSVKLTNILRDWSLVEKSEDVRFSLVEISEEHYTFYNETMEKLQKSWQIVTKGKTVKRVNTIIKKIIAQIKKVEEFQGNIASIDRQITVVKDIPMWARHFRWWKIIISQSMIEKRAFSDDNIACIIWHEMWHALLPLLELQKRGLIERMLQPKTFHQRSLFNYNTQEAQPDIIWAYIAYISGYSPNACLIWLAQIYSDIPDAHYKFRLQKLEEFLYVLEKQIAKKG